MVAASATRTRWSPSRRLRRAPRTGGSRVVVMSSNVAHRRPEFLPCARESALDSCSLRTKRHLESPVTDRPVRPATQMQTVVGLDAAGRRRPAHPPRRGRRPGGPDDHRRGAQLCRRPERADGRGDPQRRPARARRLPHPGHPAGRQRAAGAGDRGRLPARPRRGPQRPDRRGPARRLPGRRARPRGATWPTPPSRRGSTPASWRASRSWSSPTSTSCRPPRSPATPTSSRAAAASGSATSSGSPGPCSPAPRPTRSTPRPSAPTGSRPAR